MSIISFALRKREKGGSVDQIMRRKHGFLRILYRKNFDAWEYLGAHIEKDGVTFRTFAPGASRVSLIGEFNGWEETAMRRVSDGNFWECHIDSAGEGMMYKYRIYDRSGNWIDHCDPYGYGMELRPARLP